MSGVTDTRVALEARLKTIASPLATQWENAAYTPIAGTPYQQVFIMWAQPQNPEMGSFYQESGYLQVNLRYPKDTGPGTAAIRAQAIREWFARGLTLTANGLSVKIDGTPYIAPAYFDADRYVVTVKIPFVANNN